MRLIMIFIVFLENNATERNNLFYISYLFFQEESHTRNDLLDGLYNNTDTRRRAEFPPARKNERFFDIKGMRYRLIIHGRRKSVSTHHYLLSNRGGRG